VFRSFGSSGLIRKGINPNSIGRLVQNMVRKAQISSPQLYGGHSLRIGNLIPGSTGLVGRSLSKRSKLIMVARKRIHTDPLDGRPQRAC
jgi:hypothetical protein